MLGEDSPAPGWEPQSWSHPQWPLSDQRLYKPHSNCFHAVPNGRPASGHCSSGLRGPKYLGWGLNEARPL